MALTTKSFSKIVSDCAGAIQGSAAQLTNFTIGSVLRALADAMGGVGLWLQGLVLQAAALTRASTSTGTDLDTWLAQFGFSRLPASTGTAAVTFSRFTPTNQAVVPIGAGVQTADGTVKYTVTIDASNPAYSFAQGGYILAAGQASVTVPVACTVAGSGGNVTAGAINALGTAISGVDYVSNSSNVGNGVDAESDANARTRFALFIASLDQGTLQAVQSAITGVQQGLSYTIAENKLYNGQTQYGTFTVVVDDGSGTPTTALLNLVGAAIETARPLGSTYSVHAPTLVTANVVMTVATASGYVHSTVVAQVVAALNTYLSSLTLGIGLSYSILSSIAYAVPGVINVTAITLNGGTSDITATAQQRIQPGSVTVS